MDSPRTQTMTQMIQNLREVFVKFVSPTLTMFYLNFENAFKMVSQENVMEEIRLYRVSGGLLKPHESHLTGGKQRARYGNLISSKFDFKSSVPQGSVLGSLLLFIFVKDVSNCVMSNCFGYADHHKKYRNKQHNTPNSCRQNIQIMQTKINESESK